MQACKDRRHEVGKHSLVVDSFNTSVGTQVMYSCACKHQRLRGGYLARCTEESKWEPPNLPVCESDWLGPLSPREYTMLGISAGCITILIIFAINVIIRKCRRTSEKKRTKSVRDKLKEVYQSDDPLDDVIRREVERRESGRNARHNNSKPAVNGARNAAINHVPDGTRGTGVGQYYRVWNQDGSTREKFMASSLEELTNAARDRFFLASPVSLVLELDGKPIHSTEEMMVHSGKLLVALGQGQRWHPIRGQGQFIGHTNTRSLSQNMNNPARSANEGVNTSLNNSQSGSEVSGSKYNIVTRSRNYETPMLTSRLNKKLNNNNSFNGNSNNGNSNNSNSLKGCVNDAFVTDLATSKTGSTVGVQQNIRAYYSDTESQDSASMRNGSQRQDGASLSPKWRLEPGDDTGVAVYSIPREEVVLRTSSSSNASCLRATKVSEEGEEMDESNYPPADYGLDDNDDDDDVAGDNGIDKSKSNGSYNVGADSRHLSFSMNNSKHIQF